MVPTYNTSKRTSIFGNRYKKRSEEDFVEELFKLINTSNHIRTIENFFGVRSG